MSAMRLGLCLIACGAWTAAARCSAFATVDRPRNHPRRTTALLRATSPRERDVQGAASTIETKKRRRRSWEESYEDLLAYNNVHGHCNVPQSEKPLGPWVNRQRVEHSRYLRRERTSMTARRKDLLDGVGFVWDALGVSWDARYDELRIFRKKNGHCVVPRSNGRLGAWVEKQRIEYKKYCLVRESARNGDGDGDDVDDETAPKTILTEDRVSKLDDVGFVWDVRERQFEQKLGRLRIFRKMHGHIDPRYMAGPMATWVRNWEKQYRRYLDASAMGTADEETLENILCESRRLGLESVGFCEGMFDEPRTRSAKNGRASWEERYEELKEYKSKHGHCVVPKNYGALGSWVRSQRHLMKEKGGLGMKSTFESEGVLSLERVDRLNKLGFVWDVHQWQWDQKYQELLQYKQSYGHTNVPMSYGGLGLWVLNQRASHNMTPARLELLKAADFKFDLGKQIRSAAAERWQTRFDQLQEYKTKFGSFNVKQTDDPTLFNWCQHQKRSYRAKVHGKKSTLNDDRESALQSIGFLDEII